MVSFASDAFCAFVDSVKWFRCKWPSKRRLLNALCAKYPQVFVDTESNLVVSHEDFVEVVAAAAKRQPDPQMAYRIFIHYYRLRFLHALKTGEQEEAEQRRKP